MSKTVTITFEVRSHVYIRGTECNFSKSAGSPRATAWGLGWAVYLSQTRCHRSNHIG